MCPFHQEPFQLPGLFQGVSIQELCAAASWASLHTVARFYRLDVTAPTLAHSVLNVTHSV